MEAYGEQLSGGSEAREVAVQEETGKRGERVSWGSGVRQKERETEEKQNV